MRRRYFTLSIMGLILWMMTMGCDAALNKSWGPIIEADPSFAVLCGGEWNPAGGVWTGVLAALTIEFNTGQVNQTFEVALEISSPTIERSATPEVIRYSVQNLRTDPGKSSGTKSVSFLLEPKCNGQGGYIFDVMITDSSGRSATYQGTFVQVNTYIFGDDPCTCKTQCGWCKESLSDHFIRCNCGCPFVGEKCTG